MTVNSNTETTASSEIDLTKYRVTTSWPNLPEGKWLGKCSAVDIDSEGTVIVLHRGRLSSRRGKPGRELNYVTEDNEWFGTIQPEPAIMELDPHTGKIIRQWGENFFKCPHGMALDSEGNVWITDIISNEVYVFSRDGKLQTRFGELDRRGYDDRHFNGPSDVTVLPDGTVFVSDGYYGNRIIKMSSSGEHLAHWGEDGNKPGQFNLPHGLTTDDDGRLYVADRQNSRIQIFDLDGNFLDKWERPGDATPFHVLFHEGNLFIVDGGDAHVGTYSFRGITTGYDPNAIDPRTGKPVKELPLQSRQRARLIQLDRTGKEIGRAGRFGVYAGEFNLPHDIAVDHDGGIYVVDSGGHRVQKWVRSDD